jgi:ABC-2 type transport system ATP-binding protein
MRARRIAELLDQARLTDVADVPLGTFSGGMRRRIDIAAAMVHDPSILILDEPTTGLDIESRTDLWHNLSELLKDRDRSLIFTSHLLEDVERVATHVLLLVDGKSLIHATLPEFLRAAGPTHLCELRLHCAPAELASVQTLEKELARDERLAFNVTVLSDNRRQWTADAQPAHLVTLLSAAVPAGVLIESAAFQPRELASVYLRLTKRG